MSVWHILLGVLFLIICILLILIVLLQKGKGGGLGAAFGGMGSSAFGTRTGDVFTWVTIILTGLFLLLAIGTSLALRPAAGVVSNPKFFPAPRPVADDENVAVTLTCDTDGAVIRYTRDGSDPTESSTAYENAVEIEPGMTLKARAFRENWTPSEVVPGLYPKADANTVPSPDAGLLPGPGEMEAPPTTAPAVPALPPATMPAVPNTIPAMP